MSGTRMSVLEIPASNPLLFVLEDVRHAYPDSDGVHRDRHQLVSQLKRPAAAIWVRRLVRSAPDMRSVRSGTHTRSATDCRGTRRPFASIVARGPALSASCSRAESRFSCTGSGEWAGFRLRRSTHAEQSHFPRHLPLPWSKGDAVDGGRGVRRASSAANGKTRMHPRRYRHRAVALDPHRNRW